MKIKELFKQYLIKQGYKEWSPSGNPSTVYDYIKRIENVCDYEGLSWTNLKENINKLVRDYDVGGIKEDEGAISHRSVINALKRFQEFTKTID